MELIALQSFQTFLLSNLGEGNPPPTSRHPLTSSTLPPLLELQPQNEKVKTVSLLFKDCDIANTVNGSEHGLSDIGAMELRLQRAQDRSSGAHF